MLEEGVVGDKLFFIPKAASAFPYGNDSTRSMAFENIFLTSIFSFISRKPAPEYMQAVETSELPVIIHHDFSRLRKRIPGCDKIYIYILEYCLTVINSKLSILFT